MGQSTKQVMVGTIPIGGGAPVSIQSMLNILPEDLEGNIRQAKELEAAGCQILRFAVPDKSAIPLIEALKKEVSMPLVADIHYDYRLAVEAAAAGIDKIRINPGNIGSDDRVRKVVRACRSRNIPIRIGVNGGSVERHILARHGHPSPAALVESALYHASLLEAQDYDNIVLSMKSSNVEDMVRAYRLVSCTTQYPLHLGVTHAGTQRIGILKSAIGIGSLLLEGIGDTIRVSLTAPPVEEIYAAKDILKSIGQGEGVSVYSCPTCGRCKIDIISMTRQVEEALAGCELPITVAVMGCVVNGPGEAKEADLCICGGADSGALFAKGKVLGKYSQEDLIPALLGEVDKLKANFIAEGK